MEPLTLGIFSGVMIFFIFLAFFVIRYELNKQEKERSDTDDWLLHNFSLRVYRALFANRDPDEVACRMKINVMEYKRDCEIAGIKADLIKVVTKYIYGIAVLCICFMLGAIVHYSFFFVGILCLCYFCIFEKKLVHKKAMDRRNQIEIELPRFLDLLRTELNVGLPVENAIYVICERTDTLLSKEFFQALHKMEFGASEWGEAMEMIAAKYNVDSLSSFVLNVVTAYRKGVSVANAVEREYRDIHKTYILNIRDRAERIKSASLIPMFVLQLFPLIAFIALPLVVTLVQYM